MLDTSANVKHTGKIYESPPKKKPVAVALGRLGGKVGGKVWMKTMSRKEGAEFAAMGVSAWWSCLCPRSSAASAEARSPARQQRPGGLKQSGG